MKIKFLQNNVFDHYHIIYIRKYYIIGLRFSVKNIFMVKVALPDFLSDFS